MEPGRYRPASGRAGAQRRRDQCRRQRELRLRGQPVKIVGQWDGTLEHAQAIRINRATQLFEGGADPRGDGAAIGF